MKSFVSRLSLLLVGVLVVGNAGCLAPNARSMADFFRPETSVCVSKGIFGTSARAKTTQDVDLHLAGRMNPQTKEFEIEDFTVHQASSPVLKAQGERADHLVRLYELENQRQDNLGKNIALGIATGGEAGARIINAATAPFLGASIDYDGILGKGGIKLGKGSPPATPADRHESPADTQPAVSP